MKIKKLDITSFGKLRDVEITLDEKITVFTGRNEAGKSSIASFIKYMLYGFEASKKNDVFYNEKKKHTPWDSSECSGEMTFTDGEGKTYKAVRKTDARSKNTIFDENDMPFVTDNAGDYFLGVSESTYKKTAFIGQSEAAFSDNGELDSAIKNMVFSADESVDASKAMTKLDDIRKFFLGKTGRTGRIAEIDRELSELEESFESLKDKHKMLMSAEHNLEENVKLIENNEVQKSIYERKLENVLCYKAKQIIARVDEAKASMDEGKRIFYEHDALMQKDGFLPDKGYETQLRSLIGSLDNHIGRTDELEEALSDAKKSLEAVYSDENTGRIFAKLEETGESAKELCEKIKKLRKAKRINLVLAIVFLVFVVTIPVSVVFWILFAKKKNELLKVVAEYHCKSADDLLSILASRENFRAVEENAKRMIKSAENNLSENLSVVSEIISEISALCRKTDVGNEMFDSENPIETAEEYLAKITEWLLERDAISYLCHQDYVSYTALTENADIPGLTAKANAYDEEIGIDDEKSLRQKLTFYTQSVEMLTNKRIELEKTAAVLASTVAKPAEMQSRILSLKEQKKQLAEKHDALVLAIDALEKARDSMRSEAAPRIAAETSNLFSGITGGKYKALYAGENMSLSFLEEGEAEVREAGYLSTGTLDAAYISLRVALCEFLYKDKPVLVFDDAFSHMDDKRLETTLGFLEGISDKFQIIILSCHEREKKYLSGKAKIIDFEV